MGEIYINFFEKLNIFLRIFKINHMLLHFNYVNYFTVLWF